MSARLVWVLTCDGLPSHPGSCIEYPGAQHSSQADVIYCACSDGWSQVDGKVLCPSCTVARARFVAQGLLPDG